MRDLSKAVRWLEKANTTMFNHFGIKCVLYIVENQYQEVEGGVFKQKRRSFPLETIFFDAFPEMYQKLLGYIKAKLVSHKSEIRLALIFKKYSKNKQLKTELRVNQMKSNSASRDAYQLAVNREESVLFDQTDQDTEEEKITYAARPRSNTQLDSNANLESSAQMHLDPTDKVKTIRLIDKTRRAFSISIESSKAFELAIRKPRNKLKHQITRFRAWIYSTYLLLMKHHGSPTNSKDLNYVFALFAAVLTIDILLLINFTLHIFIPKTNFNEFGWLFFFVFFGIPYLSPLIAFIAAMSGNDQLLKTTGNMNSMMICFNIPLTLGFMFIHNDDPIYYLLLAFMVFVKVCLSGVSAKVRMFLINPRYSKNQEKLSKILVR